MVMLLEARGLTHDYPGGVRALAGLDLRIEKGRCLAILGPNGAGKTTVLLHLNGTLRPLSGVVLLDGQAVGYSRAALSAWRRRVGLVLQDADDQLFAASVAEDVSFGPLNLGLDERTARERVWSALEAMGIVHLAERPPHLLSYGQKKRVALAGAMAMRPEVLLLDEPTAGLDTKGTAGLLAVLDALKAAGTTLVLTTHDVDLAHRLADDVALFDKGRIVTQGRAPDVLSDAAAMRSADLERPMVIEVALKARSVGLLGEGEALPVTLDGILRLFERVNGIPAAEVTPGRSGG